MKFTKALIVGTILTVTMVSAQTVTAKTLKFANPMPVSNQQGWSETVKPFGEAIEARTDGKLKLKAYHSGALIKFADTPDAMEVGMADLAYFSTMFSPAYFPSWLFGGVLDPTTSPRNPLEGIMIASIMYDEFPSFGEELAKKNMFPLIHNATSLLSMISNVEVPDMAALEGKRMRIFAGEFHAELTKLQHASPVMTPWPEVYESLEKGIVDCMVTVTTGMNDLKLAEVAKYLYLMKVNEDSHWVAPMNASYLTGFNLNTFKKLPVDQRVIILEEAKKAESQYARDCATKWVPKAISEMEASGMKVTAWAPSEVAKWGKIAQSVYKMAEDKMNEKGLPGTKMVARYQELTALDSGKLAELYDKAWNNRIEWAKSL